MTSPSSERLRSRLAGAPIDHPSRSSDHRAAVLLPLILEGEPRILGVWRAAGGAHGGQLGLPGGRIEAGDPDSFAAALRETREEVGLDGPVEWLGRLGEYNTVVSRFRVDVHLARLSRPGPWRLQDQEIAAALEIPLARLLSIHADQPKVGTSWDLPIEVGFEFEPEPYLAGGSIPSRGVGHRRRGADGEVRHMPLIWGLTARILYDFLRLVWIPAAGE